MCLAISKNGSQEKTQKWKKVSKNKKICGKLDHEQN